MRWIQWTLPFVLMSSLVLAQDLRPCQVGKLDPAPASPPNISDDPGTTDPQCWEINNTFSFDHATNPDGSHSDFEDFALDMNYGIKPGVQAKMVIHYDSQSVPGLDTQASAFGRIEVGVKQQLYNNEQKQLTIAWFPTIDFMTPGSAAVRHGLPDTGTNLTLPILVSKRYGPVALVSNAGVILSLSDPSKPAQALMSFGAGMNVTDSTIVTGEVYRTSAFNLQDQATTGVVVGMTTKVSNNALLYMSLGKTVGATADGSAHFYALTGIKVLFGKGSASPQDVQINFKRRASTDN